MFKCKDPSLDPAGQSADPCCGLIGMHFSLSLSPAAAPRRWVWAHGSRVASCTAVVSAARLIRCQPFAGNASRRAADSRMAALTAARVLSALRQERPPSC